MPPVVRARAIECVLACAAVCVGWQFVLRPADAALATERAELAAVRAVVESEPNAAGVATALEAGAVQTAKRLVALRNAENASSTGGRLYDAINRVAAVHAVKIIRLDPTGLRMMTPPSAGKAGKPGKDDAAPLSAEVQGYRLSVRGQYHAVANFIHACEHTLGMSGVVSFRITPIPDSPRLEVEGVIETGHLRFKPGEQKPVAKRGGRT